MGVHFVDNPLLTISKIRGLKSARSSCHSSRLPEDLIVENCANLNVRLRVFRYFPQRQLIERNSRARMKTTPSEKKRVWPSELVEIFYFARPT